MIQRKWTLSVVLMLLVTALFPLQVQAFEIDTGNPDMTLRWDNTLNYSAAFRLKDPSPVLVADVNYDDGDRNFDKGLISNRIDLLSELELNLAAGGLRFSGAAYYDTVYNQDTDNDSVFNNNLGYPIDKFPEDTRDLHGRKAELLDAFAYANLDLGEMYLNLRAGRHTVIYGETLFYGSNGIAEAQGPTDIVKLLTVPSSQFKEILRPVEQVSGLLQVTPDFSIGAYYQFKWHETLIPGVGSYLSSADFAGEGARSILMGPGLAMMHTSGVEPKDSGQGGLKLRYSLANVGIDLGAYAVRYHAKAPTGFYFDPVVTMTFREVYAQDIDAYGLSATGSVGQLNWATEVSYRQNAPLVSDPQIDEGQTHDNDNNIRYAVGDTFHANLSTIYVMQPTALWDGGSFLTELAFNRTVSVEKNPSAIDPNTTDDAWSLRMLFTPTYFQVFTGLDLDVPIGLGYNFSGRSSAIGNWNGGTSKAGDVSIGLTGTYRTVWTIGVNYVKYFGREFSYVEPQNSSVVQLSFDQTLADRDFITFNINRAF